MITRCFWGILALSASLCAIESCEQQQCGYGLPNISTRLPDQCTSFDVFADVLLWSAREPAADCWAEVLSETTSSVRNDLLEVHFGWDPGFRVGIGYGMNHDQWDTQVYYTWFHTRGTDSISSAPGTVHSGFYSNFYVSNPTGGGLSGPAYSQASIDWTIQFNIFDWELGRNFWVSRSLALRPFVGAKGGWIHQSIDSTWKNPSFIGSQFTNPKFFSTGTENIKNNFWGIGPSLGINTTWNLYTNACQLFNLFGDLSGALMWGHWTFHDAFNNDVEQRVTVNLQNINSGATMIRTFMGLGWDVYLSQYHFSTKLGYESQFWLDQLQYYSFVGGRLSNALTLQGGTLEFCFDY